MQETTVILSTMTHPWGRFVDRPQIRDRLLSALLCGPKLPHDQQRRLLVAAQRGACAAALSELGVLEGASAQEAADHAAAGTAARNRLLEGLLASVVDALAEGQAPTPAMVERALTGLVTAIARVDPSRPFNLAALAVELSPASLPGQSSTGSLTEAHLSAVLSGTPLDAVSRNVLALRFGLTDGRTRTLDETAAALGLTREQVRVIEARLLARLRRHPSTAALRRPAAGAGRPGGPS